jgi:TatD DNase family protein
VWIDSHCHLTADAFDADRAAALARAEQAGVEAFVAIGSGYGVERNARAVALAETDPRVFATVGVHPHEAKEWNAGTGARLEQWLSRTRVVGIGECGLDYHYMHSERGAQREALAAQLGLARARRLPVSIHVRGEGAFDELLDLWRAEGRGELRGVLHCYTGTLEFARRALDQGLWVSFSGILTFKQDRGLRDVAAALPLDRLLVETDAPLLAPQGLRGRRNEPAWLDRVGEALARVQGRATAEVAAATSRNARQLFGLPEPALPACP